MSYEPEITTIHKFLLSPDNTIELPENAKALSAQMQGNDLALWVLLNPRMERVKRRFVVVPTGTPLQFIAPRHIDTVQMTNGFVFHVFEVI